MKRGQCKSESFPANNAKKKQLGLASVPTNINTYYMLHAVFYVHTVHTPHSVRSAQHCIHMISLLCALWCTFLCVCLLIAINDKYKIQTKKENA